MSHIEPYRQTIRRASRVEGVGLHSGRPCSVTLNPSAAGMGIIINGTRLEYGCVESGELATRVKTRSGNVSTIEHLLAAILGQQIDDVELTIEGGEVPILDGSALPWLSYLRTTTSAPVTPPTVLILDRVIEVRQGHGVVRAEPAEQFTIEVDVNYPQLGAFQYSAAVMDWKEAASARTFGFLEHHSALLARGLAQGADLGNTLVFDAAGRPLNEIGLHTDDEVARHKWIDCLGDLALLGCRLRAKVTAVRAGHRMHHQLVARLSELLA